MTTFFTADQHFGHANIIEYCNRPFDHVDEMDRALIQAWNDVIKPDDVVFHLGDFTLGDPSTARRYFAQLNGRIRVLANHWHHDRRWLPSEFGRANSYNAQGMPITICSPMQVILIPREGKKRDDVIVMCHYPLAEWDRKHHGSWHLHGHSHGKHKAPGLIMDVGVDSNQFHPVSLETVKAHMTFFQKWGCHGVEDGPRPRPWGGRQ